MSKNQAKAKNNLIRKSRNKSVEKAQSSQVKNKPKSKAKVSMKAKAAKGARVQKQKAHDILKLIETDHKPLKKLIKLLKNSDIELAQRKTAFEEFSSLLLVHAHSEQQSLYAFMEKQEELRAESFEGEVEHDLAEQMVEAVTNESDADMWSAKAKVLAELVEHHVKEEEDEMFTDVKKEVSSEQRIAIGEKYLQLKQKFEASATQADIEDDESDEEDKAGKVAEEDFRPQH
jgi:hypothetical protein